MDKFINGNTLKRLLDVKKPNVQEKIKIKYECDDVILDFSKKYKEQITKWTTCDDEIFRLLSNLLNLVQKLEIFYDVSRT